MGMNSTVELKVRAFNDAAKERVMGISLKDYNLINWTEIDPILVCEDSGLAAGRNEFDKLMEQIAEALHGEGMAYLIEAVDEDVPFATTYFYQGNGVKVRHFKMDIDPFDIEEEQDPWEIATERRKTYIPRTDWIKGTKYAAEEKELLDKYPWIDEVDDCDSGEVSDSKDFIVNDNGVLYSYYGNATNVIIPKGVCHIDEEVFRGKDLESVIIPEGVKSIRFGAFADCENLISVIMPDGMEEIGDHAFCCCPSLHDITIPDSVKEMEEGVFEESAIEHITVPKSMDRIVNSTYSYCNNLSVVVIPDHVTSIGEYAFSSCDNLTEVVLPDTLTEIGNMAFESCHNLKKINIPSGVTKIGCDTFYECDELVVTVAKGSYAEEYCKEAELKYVYY